MALAKKEEREKGEKTASTTRVFFFETRLLQSATSLPPLFFSFPRFPQTSSFACLFFPPPLLLSLARRRPLFPLTPAAASHSHLNLQKLPPLYATPFPLFTRSSFLFRRESCRRPFLFCAFLLSAYVGKLPKVLKECMRKAEFAKINLPNLP